MGTGTVQRRSTLTAPVSPDRLRPPAGALLYCHPVSGRAEPVARVETSRLPVQESTARPNAA